MDRLRVVQGTVSPGFGGLEMVIIEFHEWLLSRDIEALVLVVKDSPIEKALVERGHAKTVIAVPPDNKKEIAKHRRRLDSPSTAMVFHRHQGLKQLRFGTFQSKISLMSHTFYGVNKKSFWHQMLFRKVQQWVVLTELQKENLIQTCLIPEKKIVVIPNGVDLKRFHPSNRAFPSDRDEEIEIGVIARLDPKKGQDVAIHALKELTKLSKRKFKLHFYGENTPNEKPFSPVLHGLVSSNKLSDQVLFHGNCKNIHKEMENLDVLWVPSYQETFGRCILEAMASAVPVIASRAGGVPDIIKHEENGLMFETKNANDLAQKTIELFAQPTLFQKIRNQALLDVKRKYNQEQIWPTLFEAIKPDYLKTDFLEQSKIKAQ